MPGLAETDPKVFELIRKETHRQRDGLELIASENFVSRAVLEAVGSTLTNKYAEGLPGKRYYGGCEVVDEVEQLAIDRAKQLFKADSANVQPHSGASANIAAYFAMGLVPGDTILGMNLSHGGHLTHGSPANFSGRLFKVVAYGVDEKTGLIDYDQLASLAREHKPKVIVAGFSAYPRTLEFATFRKIADEVGAKLFADIAHVAGLVATGHYPSPIPFCEMVSTTTHKTLRGPRGGLLMARADHEKAMNSQVFPGFQGGPLEHVIAGKAVAFGEALSPAFKDYSAQVIANAKAMAGALVKSGFELVSGGTDNHLMLLDLRRREVSGKDAEAALGKAAITVNKNTVPGETRSPFVTSGIRLGSPAMTTRGMKEAEFKRIGELIADVLTDVNDEKRLARVKEEVVSLCRKFPLYPELG
ncbi:MAG TPA: serine hydroxymethyltransferase [bacterium]|nr:serine hydroxymethyltransferase [bacterium]